MTNNSPLNYNSLFSEVSQRFVQSSNAQVPFPFADRYPENQWQSQSSNYGYGYRRPTYVSQSVYSTTPRPYYANQYSQNYLAPATYSVCFYFLLIRGRGRIQVFLHLGICFTNHSHLQPVSSYSGSTFRHPVASFANEGPYGSAASQPIVEVRKSLY